MFFISIPRDEIAALDTNGVSVRINGRLHTIIRVDGCLTWTDDEGKQVKPILAAEEVEIEVRDRVGVHPCISFTCGDEVGQRLQQLGPINVLLDEDEERIDFSIGGEKQPESRKGCRFNFTPLIEYMTYRAALEGVGWKLTASDLQEFSDLGCRKYFGVTLADDGTILGDEQNPDALESYRKREFTKEQQDGYFHDGKCPQCGSTELSVGSWQEDDLSTRHRDVFCDKCEQQSQETHYRDAGIRFLEPQDSYVGEAE